MKKLNRALQKKFAGRVKAVERGGCLVLEGSLDSWDDVVAAGALAVKMTKHRTRRFLKNLQTEHRELGGVVNDIRFTGAAAPRMPAPVTDNSLEGARPDVLIIGGGVTGCAIARELARFDVRILLIDKEHDLAMHASSRNDGMVHPGVDLKKNSWKHRYNERGNAMYDDVARELGVDFERNGQYLCFKSPLFIPVLYGSLLYWKRMGIPARVMLRDELRRREPGLNRDIAAALFFPSAGVVCPYGLTIAYGENAVQNGVKISLDTEALGMETEGGRITRVHTNRGTVEAAVVINAAGVFADDIAAMAKDKFYSIHPRRGTNSILDRKFTPKIAEGIASLMGNQGAHTKGGGIIRTAHRNILVGPDAVETFEKENFATAAQSVERTFAKFKVTSPALSVGQLITSFTGVRAPVYEEDFIVCKGRRTANMVHAAGIQSPGLTAAPAIACDAARFAVELLRGMGKTVGARENFDPVRAPIPRPSAMADDERDALIKTNGDYGVILCRCEEVSKGEILESLRRPVPCDTVDGVKRRVRPGMGRCQGGFCGPLVLRLIAAEKNMPLEKVSKSGPGAEVLR